MMLEKKTFDGTDHLFLIQKRKEKIYPAIKMLEVFFFRISSKP